MVPALIGRSGDQSRQLIEFDLKRLGDCDAFHEGELAEAVEGADQGGSAHARHSGELALRQVVLDDVIANREPKGIEATGAGLALLIQGRAQLGQPPIARPISLSDFAPQFF